MKNLGKVKAIIISSIIALVMVLGLLMTFVPMNLGSKDFESFAGALSKSTTISGGMSVEYTIKESGDEKEIKNSISILTDIIRDYGFKDVTAYLKGDDKIRVDLNEPVLVSDRSQVEEFLKSVALGKLEFKNKDDVTATMTPAEGQELDPNLIVIDASKHIDKISKIHYSQASGIQIDFNKEGKNLYSAAVNQPLYMFVGGAEWPSADNNEISANKDASATSMYLMFNSADVVDSYYYTLRAGMMSIGLDKDNVEIVYNENKTALIAQVAGIVLSAVVVIGLIVLAVIKQKGFAIANIVSALIVLSLEMFLLQAMGWVVIGFSSLVALIAVALVYYVLNAVIYSSVKAENSIGKSITTSVEDGFRKNLWVVVDTLAAMFIVGFVLAITATGELVGVGTILALSAVFMGVAILLLNRAILNCIYSFVENATAFFGLTKGGRE